ncbi:hypothetical protein PR048_019447 [Dryococelus australis]|uniref:Uncharacterized protein n=1 Tax=Dryococelus australis TaxID=614101 RepID=A0ABQ9H3V8_9NEOP|nr:hypothetical protein PR048_019447 [Dryococelus australis]
MSQVIRVNCARPPERRVELVTFAGSRKFHDTNYDRHMLTFLFQVALADAELYYSACGLLARLEHAVIVSPVDEHWNARAGEAGDLRENPPTYGIVLHDSHMRKAWSSPAANRTRFALVRGRNGGISRKQNFSSGSEKFVVSINEVYDARSNTGYRGQELNPCHLNVKSVRSHCASSFDPEGLHLSTHTPHNIPHFVRKLTHGKGHGPIQLDGQIRSLLVLDYARRDCLRSVTSQQMSKPFLQLTRQMRNALTYSGTVVPSAAKFPAAVFLLAADLAQDSPASPSNDVLAKIETHGDVMLNPLLSVAFFEFIHFQCRKVENSCAVSARTAKHLNNTRGHDVVVAILLASYLGEPVERYKDDTASRFKCAIAATSKALKRIAGMKGSRETGDPRENPPTSGIVRHNSHFRKSGVSRSEFEPSSFGWEASSLTAQPRGPFRIGVQYSCRLKFTDSHVIGAHDCEVFVYWRRVTRGVSKNDWPMTNVLQSSLMVSYVSRIEYVSMEAPPRSLMTWKVRHFESDVHCTHFTDRDIQYCCEKFNPVLYELFYPWCCFVGNEAARLAVADHNFIDQGRLVLLLNSIEITGGSSVFVSRDVKVVCQIFVPNCWPAISVSGGDTDMFVPPPLDSRLLFQHPMELLLVGGNVLQSPTRKSGFNLPGNRTWFDVVGRDRLDYYPPAPIKAITIFRN